MDGAPLKTKKSSPQCQLARLRDQNLYQTEALTSSLHSTAFFCTYVPRLKKKKKEGGSNTTIAHKLSLVLSYIKKKKKSPKLTDVLNSSCMEKIELPLSRKKKKKKILDSNFSCRQIPNDLVFEL